MPTLPAPEHPNALSSAISKSDLKGDVLESKSNPPGNYGDVHTRLSDPLESSRFTAPPSPGTFFAVTTFPSPTLKYVPSLGGSISPSARTPGNLTSWPWDWEQPVDRFVPCMAESSEQGISGDHMVPLQPCGNPDLPILNLPGPASAGFGPLGSQRIGSGKGATQAKRGAVIGAGTFDDMIRSAETKRIESHLSPGHTIDRERASSLSDEQRDVALLSRTPVSHTPISEVPLDTSPPFPLLSPGVTGGDNCCDVHVGTHEQELLRGCAIRTISHISSTRPASTPLIRVSKMRDSVERRDRFDPCTTPGPPPMYADGHLVDEEDAPRTYTKFDGDAESEDTKLPLALEAAVSKKSEMATGNVPHKGPTVRDEGRQGSRCPFQLPSKTAQSSKSSATRGDGERRTFITSPLYAQMTPNRLHPDSRRNITPKESTSSSSNILRAGMAHGGAQRSRHCRNAQMVQDNVTDGSQAPPSPIRRQGVVQSTSLPLDMVASSLGSFSWNHRPNFLALHPVMTPQSAQRAASSAPDLGMENMSGYFDAAFGSTGTTGQLSRENGVSPLSWIRRQNARSKEPNDTLAPRSPARNITAPLSSLPPDDVSYPLALRSSPISTPPLTDASGPSSPSYSDSASNKSRPRSVFGGPPLPEDIERKSARHAAKITERRQKRRATLGARTWVEVRTPAQEQDQGLAPISHLAGVEPSVREWPDSPTTQTSS